MALEFQNIFTGKGVGAGEKKGETIIYGLALSVCENLLCCLP
jgi:hypothetical protein